MSRYQQQSWEFHVPRDGQNKVISFSSGDLVKPKEFMHVVNKHGKIKIHALVDTHSAETEKQVVIVGTGNYVGEEIINKLVHIGSLTFSDGQYGYHFYLISDEPETQDDFYKQIKVEFHDSTDQDDFEAMRAEILSFVVSKPQYMDFSEIDARNNGSSVITVKLKNKESGFEKTSVFRDFILNLSESDLVDVNVTNI